jgi:hypothetical protein
VSFYVDEETSKASTETAPAEYLPWYKGGIKGVPAHKAVGYCCKLVWEVFANNPYGLSPAAYLIDEETSKASTETASAEYLP